jgi:hypothetical protein
MSNLSPLIYKLSEAYVINAPELKIGEYKCH